MANLQHTEEPTKAQRERWDNQQKIVFAAFFIEPATMFQIEKETSIMRPSICRFVSGWKKSGKIKVIKIDRDPFTKCKAQFLSTNEKFWPKPEPVRVDPNSQFNLFQ